MWHNKIGNITNAVTCPGCGLSCDDLQLEVNDGQLVSLEKGCTLARSFFDTALTPHDHNPMIDGSRTSLDDAIAQSAELLRKAHAPLFAGLVTDVNGMRGTLEVADHCGAILDHCNGDGLFRNIRVLQDNGWFATTFTEVRNRADLMIVVGNQCFDRFPRLIERVLNPEHSLFSSASERKLILLGPWDSGSLPTDIEAMACTVIPVEHQQLSDAVGMLRGLVSGRPVNRQAFGNKTGDQLVELATQLKTAKYSVIAWSATELDFPHAELTIQGLVDLIKDLNLTTRSAALPLAGTLADVTSNQVCTWQLGYPLRTRLQRSYPEHDPLINRYQTLIAQKETDLLMWISSLSPRVVPPVTNSPTIVLGHPGMTFENDPDVYIPVGVPGVDHPGHWYRSDAVCPMPLGRLRESDLPAVSQVMMLLNDKLRQATGE
ncbi:MAG: formylmethanofuran dehydrogenase subunit B [Candidatus Thiodiazotropha sp. (ex Rostrolucina anterorostrata)]|nr:formylmethanofuran dehydrogenase subunit B [Candidatus Thiodiazotropha sp. (ex Rostrolucina anterorostrata)]